MHSLGTAENILKSVIAEVEKHQEKHIERIELSLDDHEFLEADEVRFCFELLAKGTIAEGAPMEIRRADSTNGDVPSIVLQLS